MTVNGTVTETMPPAIRRVRAYFAPVDRAAGLPTIFDPAQSGGFALDAPPEPWMDLGWIQGFERTSGTVIAAVKAGAPAVTQMQVRSDVEATVRFRFESWGKLQLSLAAGTQQMNLLAVVSGASAAGSGGTALAAVALAAGSTATALDVGPAAARNVFGRRAGSCGCGLREWADGVCRQRSEWSLRAHRVDGRRLRAAGDAECWAG